MPEVITSDLAVVFGQPSRMASSSIRRERTEDGGQKKPRSNNTQSPVLSPQSFGTLLAFDFGTKRIGVAVGNTLLCRANPLTTINDEKTDVRFAKIAALIKEWQPSALIVGLPSNENGTSHEMTMLCRRFANRLKGRFNLPTILLDERYTSFAASVQMNEEGIHGMKQKALVDQYAAQQILQAYFEEPQAGVIA